MNLRALVLDFHPAWKCVGLGLLFSLRSLAGEYVATAEEFELALNQHRAEVANEANRQADVNLKAPSVGDSGHWDNTAYDQLRQRALLELQRRAAIFAFIRDYSLDLPSDFYALKRRREEENAARAARIAQGGIVRGLREFSLPAWIDYVTSTAAIQLKERMIKEGRLFIAASAPTDRSALRNLHDDDDSPGARQQRQLAAERAMIDRQFEELVSQRAAGFEIRVE